MNNEEANVLIGRISREAQWLQNVETKSLGALYVYAYDPYQERTVQFTSIKNFDGYLEALERHRAQGKSWKQS